MPEAFRFTDADVNSLEIVRRVIFRRLREDRSWGQFDVTGEGFRPYADVPGHLRSRFLVLANEVMWELIIQGVITPGTDSANPNLPFFRITDYGHKVLEADRFVPHDPTGYLAEVRAAAPSHVGEVAFVYLEEALECFTRNCHVASVLLLGVAAEAVFLDLCRVVSRSIPDPNTRKRFDKLSSLVDKHRWIVARYHALPNAVKRQDLPESLDITLGSLQDLIRRQRNELGHPQETPPRMTRDEAFIFFHMFPPYLRDIAAFASFCESQGI